jgi:hypothetical protein
MDDFFQLKSYILILNKNVLGYILSDFFHPLIWSPCMQGRNNRHAEKRPSMYVGERDERSGNVDLQTNRKMT